MAQSHDRQVYAEEQKLLEKHQKASGSGTSAAAAPPAIHITSVLPPPSGPTLHRASSAGTPAPDIPSHTPVDRLSIPGFRDDAVKEYCAWQRSQVKEPALKAGFQTACGVILKRGLDLELIRRDSNPKFLIHEDVQEGIAEHVISNIDYWFENIKRPRLGE